MRQESGEKPVIIVRGLRKHFGALSVINGVDLVVGPGEVVVIIGPSGGGKSTFLRCLNFLEEPSAGTIEIDGVVVKAKDRAGQRGKRIREIRQRAAMIFQDFNLFPHLTVLGNLIEGAVAVKGVPKKQAIAKAEEILTEMGLLAKRDEFPARLSVGQQQQVAIARSLCLEPKVMLFDDPTSNLDPGLINQLVSVIEQLAAERIAMIIVTHNVYLARSVADRVIFMADGEWVEMGPPDELLSNPRQERTRRFLKQIASDLF
jgi:ABC-type polar amino acid transport system ATPase subunit